MSVCEGGGVRGERVYMHDGRGDTTMVVVMYVDVTYK